MKYIRIVSTIALLLIFSPPAFSMQTQITQKTKGCCFICFGKCDPQLYTGDVLLSDFICKEKTCKDSFIHIQCLVLWEHANNSVFKKTDASYNYKCPYCCEKIKKNILIPKYKKFVSDYLEKNKKILADPNLSKQELLTTQTLEKIISEVQLTCGLFTTEEEAESANSRIEIIYTNTIDQMNKTLQDRINHMNKTLKEKGRIKKNRLAIGICTITLSAPCIFFTIVPLVVNSFALLFYDHRIEYSDRIFNTALVTAAIISIVIAKKIGVHAGHYFFPDKKINK